MKKEKAYHNIYKSVPYLLSCNKSCNRVTIVSVTRRLSYLACMQYLLYIRTFRLQGNNFTSRLHLLLYLGFGLVVVQTRNLFAFVCLNKPFIIHSKLLLFYLTWLSCHAVTGPPVPHTLTGAFSRLIFQD